MGDIDWKVRLTEQGADITIVGHSYGADAAFGLMPRFPRGVNTLISIDPVGRLRPSWASVRSKCRRWLNVRAESNRSL